MDPIIEMLLREGIAHHALQAGHISNGLHLEELATEEEQIARAKLYRKFRNAGEKPKIAYQRAIRGEEVTSMDDVLNDLANHG